MEQEMKDAYFAGLFDGEGCVRINRRQRGKYIEHIQFYTLSQKDGRIIDWIVRNYGGFVHYGKSSEYRKPVFTWIVTNKKGREIMKRILPFLIYKKDQVEKTLQFNSLTNRKKGVNQSEMENRDRLMEEVKKLKKVIVPSMFAGSTTKRTDPKGM